MPSFDDTPATRTHPDAPDPTANDPAAPDPASASERILAAGVRLFAGRGYDATPVRRVAEEAGVATGLVYYHFTDKAGLLRAIFQRGRAQVEDSLAEAKAASADGPRSGLDRLVRTAFAAVARDPDFWRLSYQLRMQRGVSEALEEGLAESSEAIRAQLEELLRRGDHPAPVPASRALFAAVDGAAQHFVLDLDRYPLDRVAGALVDAFAPRDPQ